MTRSLPLVLGLLGALSLACTMDGSGDTAKSATDSAPTAYFFWVGAVATYDTGPADGMFGIGVFGSQEGDFICMNTGDLVQTGIPDEECSGCIYTYTFTVENTIPDGDFCNAVGLTEEGDYDGYDIGFGWGAEAYYYNNGYYTYVFEDPIWGYYEGDWFLFAYSYDSANYTYNSPTYMQFMSRFIQYYNGGYYWVYGGYSRD